MVAPPGVDGPGGVAGLYVAPGGLLAVMALGNGPDNVETTVTGAPAPTLIVEPV